MNKLSVSTSFMQYLERHQGYAVNRMLLGFCKGENLHLCTFEIDYLSQRTDGQISYLPKGKEHRTTDAGRWARDGRQAGKAARVVRKLFTQEALSELKDVDFEAFANRYKSSNENIVFNITNKVSAVYDMYVDEDAGGSLSGSCMNGDTHLLGIYDGSDKCRCIYATNTDGGLIGRALLWSDVEIELPDGSVVVGTFMDRVYTYTDSARQSFLDFAEEKGWWVRQNPNTYEYKRDWISPEGEPVRVKACVRTPALSTYMNKMPYIDTFAYVGGDAISNDRNNESVYAEATHTTGSVNEYRWPDEVFGGWIPDGMVVTLCPTSMHAGLHTSIDNVFDVTRHGWMLRDGETRPIRVISGQYYLDEDVVFSNYNGSWYMKEDVVWSEHVSSYIGTYLAQQLVDGSYAPAVMCVNRAEGWCLLSEEPKSRQHPQHASHADTLTLEAARAYTPPVSDDIDIIIGDTVHPF